MAMPDPDEDDLDLFPTEQDQIAREWALERLHNFVDSHLMEEGGLSLSQISNLLEEYQLTLLGYLTDSE